MLINDIKVQDEKIVIITESQILKALGLSNKKYELCDVIVDYNKRVIIKVKTKDKKCKDIKMNLMEAKTLDAYIATAEDMKDVTVTFYGE